MLTTHDLADIERLCRRLVVIERGRVVHDGSLAALHARYGSRRRVVVLLDEPVAPLPKGPGLTVESVQGEGRRVTFALDGGGVAAADLVRRLAGIPALRDIAILEPRIEDVVARLYPSASPAAARRRTARRRGDPSRSRTGQRPRGRARSSLAGGARPPSAAP